MHEKILIVEDENIIALDIRNRLRKMGYDISAIVPSGEEAILEIENNEPDLILMDILLRGKMDGIHTAKKINETKSIPIIYLTSYSDEPTMRRARNTNFYGYLLKPFNENELNLKIRKAFAG